MILNGQGQQSFVCQTQQQPQQRKLTNDENKMLNQQQSQPANLIPKQEAMETSTSMDKHQAQQHHHHIDNGYDNMSYSSTQQNTPIPSPAKSSNNNLGTFSMNHFLINKAI